MADAMYEQHYQLLVARRGVHLITEKMKYWETWSRLSEIDRQARPTSTTLSLNYRRMLYG